MNAESGSRSGGQNRRQEPRLHIHVFQVEEMTSLKTETLRFHFQERWLVCCIAVCYVPEGVWYSGRIGWQKKRGTERMG